MIMRSIYKMFLLSVALLTGTLAVSCSSDKDDITKRIEHRNEHYSSYQDRRTQRRDARQERTDRWFDRTMGQPARTETGLKLPD